MGDNQQANTWQEIMQGATKWLGWLGYITLGVMAKLAFDSRKTPLTKKQIVVKSVLSIFCGYLAAVICEYYNRVELAKIVVPVATLLGEALVMYIMSNYKKLISKLLPPIFQGLKDIKKDDE